MTNQSGAYTDNPTISKIIKVDPLILSQNSLILEFTFAENAPSRDFRLYIQDPRTEAPVATLATETTSQNFNTFSLNSYWKSEATWEEAFYEIFKWVKRVLLVTQFYVIFARPALNEIHKAPIAWFGSSIMMIQAFFWIPYISGSFGGVIDSILRGVARARQDFFGQSTSAFIISRDFVRTSENLYQNKLFPRVDRIEAEQLWFPNPLIDTKYEVILLIFGILFPVFASAMKNQFLGRLAKNMKSGMVISFVFPVLNNAVMCIIQLFWAGEYGTFELVTSILSLALVVILVVELISLYYPAKYSTDYFNYETGLIDFDCHHRVPLNGLVKKLEVWLLMFIPTITWLISNFRLASPIVFLCIYLTITIIDLGKASAHKNFRKDLVTINYLKTLDSLFRSFLVLIMCFYWQTEMKERGNKWLTVLFVITIFLNLLLFAIIWIARISYEVSKAQNWRTLEEEYPEIPSELLDVNKALASIGKLKNNHGPVSTTQIVPVSSASKQNASKAPEGEKAPLVPQTENRVE